MPHSQFRSTKKLFKEVIRKQLHETPANYVEKEAALPAYAHNNPLVDFLFWGRLRVAEQMLKKLFPQSDKLRILDFGCGTGVMSYYLGSCGHQVVGVDTVLEPLNKLQKKIHFPHTCQFVSATQIESEPAHSFDCIIALDVLEHVESLDAVIATFRRLVKPDGVMIISGPTENILYRIGRKLAGPEFSGEYHVSTIRNIQERFQQESDVLKTKTLYPLLPLFTVFSCRFIEQ